MNDFKPNSHRYKEEQKQSDAEKKKVEKVVSGTAKIKKKNAAHKFADVFIAEDTNNVKSYIVMDVLVPALKKLVSDIITDGIDMILYGNTGHGKRNSSRSNSSYIDYRGISSNKRDERRYERDYSARARYDFGDVILDSKGEAEDVLESMDELIDQYGMVTVADLYDLIGVSCDYTDNKYGWTNISSASVVRVGGGGYMLKLPRVKSL